MTKESFVGTYAIGPGRRKFGRKRLNVNVSCSKNDKIPSIDCTQMKSLPKKIDNNKDFKQSDN